MKKLLLVLFVLLFIACENPVEPVEIINSETINLYDDINFCKSNFNKIILINCTNRPLKIKHYSTVNINQYGFICYNKNMTITIMPTNKKTFILDSSIYQWIEYNN